MTVDPLISLALFMLVLWCLGRLGDAVYIGLVFEILTGVLLGPPLANRVPYPDAITLLGQLGLVLLVIEGGLHVDGKKIRDIGPLAIAIAVTGTTLPVLLGWGMLLLLQFGYLEGIAAGIALSSTSIGMATKLLQSNEQLTTRLGSVITVAAMVDDVLSLILLAVFSQVSGANVGGSTANTTAWTYLEPMVMSIAITMIGLVMTYLVPRLCLAYERIYDHYTSSAPHNRIGRMTQSVLQGMSPGVFLLVFMTLVGVGMVYLSSLLGTTYLLGR